MCCVNPAFTTVPVRVGEKAEGKPVFRDELPVADRMIRAHTQHRAVQLIVLVFQVAKPFATQVSAVLNGDALKAAAGNSLRWLPTIRPADCDIPTTAP